MDKKVNKIIEDLYLLQPSLKLHEPDLVKMITSILEAKPDTSFDEDFAITLRDKLIKSDVKHLNSKRFSSIVSPYTRFFQSKSFAVLTTSLILVLLIVIPLSHNNSSVFNQSIKREVGSKFGILGISKNDDNTFSNNFAKKESATMAMFAGEFGTLKKDQLKPNYVYEKSPFVLNEKEVSVYKRLKGIYTDDNIKNLLQKISSLENNNYTVTINFSEGFLNIYNNAHHNTDYTNNEPKIRSKNDLVNIADSFLKRLEIQLKHYGTPIVLEDSNTVVYPLLIDGFEVYEEDGRPYGITVNIDQYTDVVTELFGVSSQTYEGSPYTAISNSETVLSLINETKDNSGPKIQLLEPKRILVKYHDGNELYIPALMFKVENENHYPTSVIVPLIQEN